jgi:hypothetical protein
LSNASASPQLLRRLTDRRIGNMVSNLRLFFTFMIDFIF